MGFKLVAVRVVYSEAVAVEVTSCVLVMLDRNSPIVVLVACRTVVYSELDEEVSVLTTLEIDV